ncbi:unnamed protein product, partial [Rangifer tarandus platyrhynchus]
RQVRPRKPPLAGAAEAAHHDCRAGRARSRNSCRPCLRSLSLQPEKPPRREARAPPLEKSPHGTEVSAQPK